MRRAPARRRRAARAVRREELVFYLHNPWFHAKLGLFLLAGLLSIVPTLRYLRWRRAWREAPGFLPTPGELARVRGLVRLQLVLLAAVFVLAAAVARYGGF